MVEPAHRVVHLKDGFPSNTEDALWMQALAKEADLVIVTADSRIDFNETSRLKVLLNQIRSK